MPDCKFISRLGVGIDNIDIADYRACGVWVVNVPDYGVDEVATHAITLMLAQHRGLPTLIKNNLAGLWSSREIQPIVWLTELTLGVMGYGAIGRTTGSKGAGVGMRVIAYDPFLSDDEIRTAGSGAGQPGPTFERVGFYIPAPAAGREHAAYHQRSQPLE